MSGQEELGQENPLKVCRRLIYLHRLVGDDVLTAKPKSIRPNPWRVTIVFTFYTVCATMSILGYVDVGFINAVNVGLSDVLGTTPYSVANGIEKTAKDISSVNEVKSYLVNAFFPQLLLGRTYSEPGALRGFNRVLGRIGFCQNTSVVLLTVRRIKTQRDGRTTTTDKFEPLYQNTWMGYGVPSGSAPTDEEDKTDMWGTYYQPSTGFLDRLKIPLARLGYTKVGSRAKLTKEFLQNAATPNISVNVKWKYSPACTGDKCDFNGGYLNAGGYVAAIVAKSSEKHQALLKKMEQRRGNQIEWRELSVIANDLYIHLLDPEGHAVNDTELGTCADGVKVTNIMRFEDFVETVLLNEYTASVATSFYTYNANMQTVTNVALKWNMLPVGIAGGDFKVHVKTIKLDLLDTYNIFFEIIYILGTAFYFIELFVYKLYKRSYKLFHDIWTWVNTLSIVASCLSVAFRFQYGSLNKSFLVASQNINFEMDDQHIRNLDDQASLGYFYQVTSSIALVTIWLRIVELLAKTPPRVKLLEQTLIKAMTAMLIYFSYIMVVLVGFWAFTAVHFANVSVVFGHPIKAFISCFEMLCLNVAPYSTTVGAPLRVAFLFPYFLFSIISVQMFNSIINYAYNRVSVDMEPVFKKALRDRKNKEKMSKGGPLAMLKPVITLIKTKLGMMKAADDDDDAEIDKKTKKKDQGAAPSIEDLLAADKEKVEQFQLKAQKKPTNEGMMTICLYGIFAVSYVLFLWLALQIGKNGKISEIMSAAIFDKEVQVKHPSGGEYFRTFEDIASIYDVSYWMRKALPDIVASGQERDESVLASQFYPGNVSCFKNWNCLVDGKIKTDSVRKMIRVTQRLLKRVPNHGLVSLDPVVLKPERFASGSKLVPVRCPSKEISVNSPAGDSEDTTTEMNLYFGDRQFCKRETAGGFKGFGGIVCMLDADPLNMTNQLAEMMEKGFFSLSSGAILVEFLAYNGNADSLIHTQLEFSQRMTGTVTTKGSILAFTLLGVDGPKDKASTADLLILVFMNCFKPDMICGLIYMSLVGVFVVQMIKELKQDIYRKKYNEDKPPSTSLVEYFALDLFHTLDAASYIISIVSFVLFLLWLSEQMHIESKKNEDYSDFMTYIDNLVLQRQMYRTLSTINLLCVFVRPLKFVRNDPRMSKLNMTFWMAMGDIAWFNVMLSIFFFGFVLFAHVIFGIELYALSDLFKSMVYCFKFLIGSFNFWELWAISEWSAMCFVFGFLFLFKFFFLNIFFAIIDKFFISGDAPPINVRRVMKPMLGRLCRWIEWDKDLVMEGDSSKSESDGPPSRAAKVHNFSMLIQEIHNMNYDEDSAVVKKSKALSDVCDVDERMNEVLRWSRDEAKSFVESYRRMQFEKQEFSNDEVFLKVKVRNVIEKELEHMRESMNEAERHQRYAIMVNENLAKKDQETLAKYINRLERKITDKKIESHALETDVFHLKAESHKMRYTDDEMKHMNIEDVTPAQRQPQAAALGDKPGAPGAAEDEEMSDGDAADDEIPKEDPGLGADASGKQGTTDADLVLALGGAPEE